MTPLRRLLVGLWLGGCLGLALGGEASQDLVILPKFEVTAGAFAFSMTWRCRWPTQKSKIIRAWFTQIPKGGMAERAGLRNDDRLLKYDDVVLAEISGEWLSKRLKEPWNAGEVHRFLVERDGKQMSFTIEVTKKPTRRNPMASSRLRRPEQARLDNNGPAATSGGADWIWRPRSPERRTRRRQWGSALATGSEYQDPV